MIYRITQKLFQLGFKLFFRQVHIAGLENIPESTKLWKELIELSEIE